MPESCTVYCRSEISELVARELLAGFGSGKWESNESDWGVFEASEKDASIQLTRMCFRERGDKFCRLLLSTCTFIQSNKWHSTTRRDEIIRQVEICEMAIGVVAEPGFEADERFNPLVFAIAEAGDGFVFNGTEFLGRFGKPILSQA
jgi:hypothetical protein